MILHGNGGVLLEKVGGVAHVDYSSAWVRNWAVQPNGEVHHFVADGTLRIIVPQRPGYVFAGWKNPKGESQGVGAGTTPLLELTATWVPRKVRVTFEPQGGAFSNGQTSSHYFETDYSESKTVASGWYQEAMSRSGYSFNGWYTHASGGDRISGEIPLPTDDTTYYAHWKGHELIFDWDTDVGDHVMRTTQTYSSDATLEPSTPPAKSGYAFLGWFTTPEGGEQVDRSTKLPTSSRAFYARWSAKGLFVDPGAGYLVEDGVAHWGHLLDLEGGSVELLRLRTGPFLRLVR